MTTDLVPKNITAVQLFSENGLDPVLDKIRAEIDKFEPNMKTDKGRKEIASFARTIASSKVFIEKAGKELVSGIKSKAKLIDIERKRSRDTLDMWRDEVREPLTKFEEEEKARIETERQFEIYLLEWDEALAEDDIFNRERTIAAKESKLAKQEEERLAKEQAEQDEIDRVANEIKIKEDAKKQAEYDASEVIKWAKIKRITDLGLALDEGGIQWAKDDINISVVEFQTFNDDNFDALILKVKTEIDKRAKEKVKADQEAAVKKANEDAELKAKSEKDAEERRIAEEKRIAEKKAANTRHQAHVNNKVKESLISLGIDEETAKKIIISTAKGEIEFLKILY